MLNILRKRAQSLLIQGVVLVIAVVFIFWGVGTNITRNRNSVATVNGEEISLQEFQRSYERAVDNLRQQFGGQLPPDLLENAGFKQQVLGQLIRDALLRQGGQRMGIAVSDHMTRQKIGTMEVFQENGHFDLHRYEEILAQNRMTPTSFENGLRSDLLAAKVGEAVAAFAYVSDLEAKTWSRFQDESIRLAYLKLDARQFEDKVQIDEAELVGWFENHREDYRQEPKRRLKYLYFSSEAGKNAAEATEDEVRAYYEANKTAYVTPEQRRARHILFKVEQGADETARSEKKQQALKILAQAEAGEDFAELAKKYSEGPSRDNGGDLGFFGRGRMVRPFEDAVFAMQPGEIRGPVETRFGFHIIKLEEIRPETVRPFDEVKQEIRRQLVAKAASAESFKKASEAYEGIMRAGSLEKFAAASGLEIRETDYFQRKSPPKDQKVLADPAFLAEAFSLNKGELSSVIEVKGGYAILYVDDIQESSLPELSEVRNRVEADFRREKSVELARKAAEDTLVAARESGALAADDGIPAEVEETDMVKRSAADKTGKVIPAVFRHAFALPWDKKFPDQPVASGTVFFVYQVLDRAEGEEPADTKTLSRIREQLSAAARSRLMNHWLATLQKQADIWTNRKLLQ